MHMQSVKTTTDVCILCRVFCGGVVPNSGVVPTRVVSCCKWYVDVLVGGISPHAPTFGDLLCV
jgi:hypothetical protein